MPFNCKALFPISNSLRGIRDIWIWGSGYPLLRVPLTRRAHRESWCTKCISNKLFMFRHIVGAKGLRESCRIKKEHTTRFYYFAFLGYFIA
ncbi:hypothetical protein Hanom_Chr17g01530991 [Helianthus anomalus]